MIVAEHREIGKARRTGGVEWKRGLKMNLDKTDVMWVGKERGELNIRLIGRDIKQVNNFVYLGGNIIMETTFRELPVQVLKFSAVFMFMLNLFFI